MDSKNKRIALLAASYLLQYPDAYWFQGLQELQEEVENLNGEAYSEALSNFIEFSRNSNELDMAETYTNTVEFSKDTTLYMTYYTFKEKRERGIALLNLKNRYLQSGINFTENELPDFLPVILEYTAATGEEDVLEAYLPEFKNIFNILNKANNPYSLVLQAILTTLGKAELSEESKGSVESIIIGRC